MTPALQMPYREKAATEIGPRLFRKQILKVGEIPYKGRRLKFDRDYLAQAVESFNAGAFDQVPFVLADDDNEHPATPRDRNPNGPERYRGEVKALELAGDGIDALVELTADGAEIVRKNPKLGVSARLVADREANGRVFPVAIEHVCGTLNPRVTGLRPWEADSIRSLTQSSDQEVIDLSAAEYMTEKNTTLTDDHLEALKGLEGEARVTKARELLGEMTTESKTEKPAEKKFSLKGLLGIKDDGVTDDDIEAAISAAEKETETEDEREPVAASLSDDDRKRIDLAEERARKADEKVAAAEWKAERTERALKGCPPAMLDLAEPILKSGQDVAIDLSGGNKADAAEVIRGLLDAAAGYVDLSAAKGSDDDSDPDVKAAKEKAADDKAWRAA